MAEWLRRWTANPLDSVRAGSNPVNIVSNYNNASLAQLAEHRILDPRVAGSNPVGGYLRNLTATYRNCLLSRWSRVQVPLEVLASIAQSVEHRIQPKISVTTI